MVDCSERLYGKVLKISNLFLFGMAE